MHIVTTDIPATLVGEAVSKSIAEHDGDVMCLLSGGSALEVVEFIAKPTDKPECRTIFMMGDERGTGEEEINNSLQLLKTHPGHYVAKNLISTVPHEDENLELFASRISETFSTELSKLQNPKIIQVLGVGSDGHTAGIFPLPEDEFYKVYPRDLGIVPVRVEGLTIDSRASFTPDWILRNVDQVLGYAVGVSKSAILESLKNESKAINERPAEILKLHKDAVVYTDQVVE